MLLGAILAPTDPVLASDVQVREPRRPGPAALRPDRRGGPERRDRLPVRDAGPRAARAARARRRRAGAGSRSTWPGPSPGAWRSARCWGRLVGRLVLYLRRDHHEAVGLDDFLALGLIAPLVRRRAAAACVGLPGGLRGRPRAARVDGARWASSRTEEPGRRQRDGRRARDAPGEGAGRTWRRRCWPSTSRSSGSARSRSCCSLAAMLSLATARRGSLWFVAAAVPGDPPAGGLRRAGLARRLRATQRRLIAWFGIRGIGSIYYLSFAVVHGLPGRAGSAAHGTGPGRRERFGRRPRHLGHAADDLVRTAQDATPPRCRLNGGSRWGLANRCPRYRSAGARLTSAGRAANPDAGRPCPRLPHRRTSVPGDVRWRCRTLRSPAAARSTAGPTAAHNRPNQCGPR